MPQRFEKVADGIPGAEGPVLDRAGLVASQRHGREVRYVVRPEPLLQTAAWMARLAAQWDARLEAIRALAEE